MQQKPSEAVTEAGSAAVDAAVDAVVVGAGVVGCAMTRRLALAGLRVVLIEAAEDILAGASKANSAILHTGFDAPEGSLELDCIREGHAEYLSIRDGMNLPLVRTGALVCAWDDEQAAKMEAIAGQAHRNGVTDVRRLTAAEAHARAPGVSRRLVAAVEVPREHVIDPWSAPYAYLRHAIAAGATVLRGAALRAGRREGGRWILDTARGRIDTGWVVNCAGLQGDRVERLLGRAPEFEIRPRKGQFVVLDKAAAALVPTILLPVPTATTKGIVVCPTAFGNVLVGPTAEEQDDRSRATTDSATLAMLIDTAARIVPGLAAIPVTATYAGLRPATEAKHYRINVDAAEGVATVGGIRSTGLSAALGIAAHVARAMGAGAVSNAAPVPVPNLAETGPRDWQAEAHGEIVCQCELVTRREIEAALSGPLPARTFGELRRRTRAAMGRCQGFNCQARIAALAAGRLEPAMAEPLAAGHNPAEAEG